MDRRAFLTGVGSIGAASAAGWSALQASARSARATGLAKAAGAIPKAGAKAAASTLPHGLTVGYLPGSGGLLDYAARGQRWDFTAREMRWAEWNTSLIPPSYDSRVDLAFGRLQVAQVWANPDLVRSIEVVAHFALDGAPDFAPFNAWRYDGAVKGKLAKATSSIVFEAAVPDRVGLQVNYAFAREQVLEGISNAGMVYLPVGARDGPGIGIYVLASPSRITGAVPDFSSR